MKAVSIGLEIHVALKTERKIFSPELLEDSSWVSFGFVGTLPTINLDAVEKTIRLSRALNCAVNYGYITFDRKNYFYYDLPRGYQITQFFNPIGTKGYMDLSNGKRIGIKQIHAEEDTAQQFKNESTIAFNFSRLGRGLAEIVTEPDFSSYEEVEEFLRAFRRICTFNGISNAAYEDGEIRVDLNISVRNSESEKLNPKSEVKNLNSLQAIRHSIEYLVEMQSKSLDAGAPMESFTYAWSEKLNRCEVMRKKGEASDYFYVPEANIPAFSISKEKYEELVSDLIIDFEALGEDLRNRGLKDSEVEFLLGNKGAFDLVSRLDSKLVNLPLSYNGIVNIVSGMLDSCDWNSLPYSEIEKAVLETEREGKISMKIAKSILKEMLSNGLTFEKAKGKLNVSLITDKEEIRKLVVGAFEQYADQIPKLRENPMKLEKLIIGECMKRSRGQADPLIVKALFDEIVGGKV